MKKAASFLLALLLIIGSLSLCVSAENIKDTNIVTKSGHYLVVKANNADQVFAPGAIFAWGLGSWLEPYTEGVKIKGGISSLTELTVAYGGTSGIEAVPGTFITSTLKYFAITYKSDSASKMGLKFAPVDMSEWGTAKYYCSFDLEASSDYTTALIALPENVLFDNTPFLLSWLMESAPSDIYVKEFGFFASENDLKQYNEPVRTTNIITSKDHYLVVKTDRADEVFAANSIFSWGLSSYLKPYDEGVMITSGINGFTELSVAYGGTAGIENIPGTFITSTLKYYAITYKSASDSVMGFKFAPTDAEGWINGWSNLTNYFSFTLKATDDYKTVLFALPENVTLSATPFLFGWCMESSPSDVYVKEFGFFASEADFNDYYGIQTETVRDTNIISKNGEYLIIKTDKADEVFAADSIFHWGLGSNLEAYEEGVKIKGGISSLTELTVAYGNTSGLEKDPGTLITSKLKFFAINYKSDSDIVMGLKFAPVEATWGADWTSSSYYFNFTLEASSDYTTAIIELPENLKFDSTPFLVGWEAESVPDDAYIREFGFFATENTARGHYGLPLITIRDTNIITNKDHYLIVKTDKADEVFAAGSIFHWGLSSYLKPYDIGVMIKSGITSLTELSVAYGGTSGIESEAGTFITSTLKYFAITYKTDSTALMGLKFAPVENNWGTDWIANKHYFKFNLPASEDYRTIVVEIPSHLQFDATPFLFGWEMESALDDIYVTEFGFFASKSEAYDYYGITVEEESNDKDVLLPIIVSTPDILDVITAGSALTNNPALTSVSEFSSNLLNSTSLASSAAFIRHNVLKAIGLR